MPDTKQVKVFEISTALVDDLNTKQICAETTSDTDLGFKMWGGKDVDGNITRWLAKDKNAQIADLKITGDVTVSTFGLGIVKSSAQGLLSSSFLIASDIPTHTQNANTILIPSGIGTSTYDDMQDYLNLCQSSGRLTGGVITKHTAGGADGSIDISELEGFVHTVNTLGNPLIPFKKAASQLSTLTDLSVNFIIATYSGGNIVYSASLTRPVNNTYNAFVIGRCFRSGTSVEVLTTGQNVYDMYGRAQDRLLAKYGNMDHASGAIISAHATPLRLSCTAGVWYFGNSPVITDLKNTFEVWYKTNKGAWTESATLTLFSEVFDGGTSKVFETYQNGTSLGALTANKYGVYWIFVCPQQADPMYVVLGDATYANIGAAQAAAVPANLPPYCVNWARLVGKVIIKNSAAAFFSVESVFDNKFVLSAATDHASLANLTWSDSGHSGLTAGTIAKGGASGIGLADSVILESALGSIGIGVTPDASLKLDINGGIRCLSSTNIPTSGTGLEFYYDTNADEGYILCGTRVNGVLAVQKNLGMGWSGRQLYLKGGDQYSSKIGVNTVVPATRVDIRDNGTDAGSVVRILTDDNSPYSLMLGNAQYSTGVTTGLGFYVEGNGDGYISNTDAGKKLFLNTYGGDVVVSNLGLGIVHSSASGVLSSSALTSAEIAHTILSAAHTDTLAGNIVDGDTLIGNVTPKLSRLAISIPAANVRNVLGVDNGELRPSWKTTLDATNPTTIGINDTAAPGTSLIFSHRDHQHASPATWTATAHNLLSAAHGGDALTESVVAGDMIIGNATPKWSRLSIGGATNSILTRGASLPAWSTYYLTGTAGGTTTFAVTNAKTLTLTATDSYNLTIPKTGTAVVGTGTAGNLTKWITDSNTVTNCMLIETAGGIDIPNTKYFGIGAAAAREEFHAGGTINFASCNIAMGTAAALDMIAGNVAGNLTTNTGIHIISALENAVIVLESSAIPNGVGYGRLLFASTNTGKTCAIQGYGGTHIYMGSCATNTAINYEWVHVSDAGFVFNDTNKAMTYSFKTDTDGNGMFLTDTGLGVGGAPNVKLDVIGSADTQLRIYASGANSYSLLKLKNASGDTNIGINGTAGQILTGSTDGGFCLNCMTGQPIYICADVGQVASEGLTLLETGNFGVGTTSPSSKLTVVGNSVAGQAALDASNSNTTPDAGMQQIAINTNKLRFGVSTSSSAYGAIASNGSTSGITFVTNNGSTWSEKMIITSNGNVGIGTTTFNASAITCFTIADGTAPASPTSNQIYLYSLSGEAYVLDSSGNQTKFSPHDENGEWEYYSENKKTGKRMKIKMEKLCKYIDKLYNTNFVEELNGKELQRR